MTVSGGTDLPADSVATADSVDLLLLNHHVSRFYPTLIAFLLCVIVAGAYGAATVSTRILIVQALPAAIALVALFLA